MASRCSRCSCAERASRLCRISHANAITSANPPLPLKTTSGHKASMSRTASSAASKHSPLPEITSLTAPTLVVCSRKWSNSLISSASAFISALLASLIDNLDFGRAPTDCGWSLVETEPDRYAFVNSTPRLLSSYRFPPRTNFSFVPAGGKGSTLFVVSTCTTTISSISSSPPLPGFVVLFLVLPSTLRKAYSTLSTKNFVGFSADHSTVFVGFAELFLASFSNPTPRA